MIWTLFVSKLKFVLPPSRRCMPQKKSCNHVDWHDTVKTQTYWHTWKNTWWALVHHSAFGWFSSLLSFKVDWWTKDFFNLTFLKGGTSCLLPEGNNLYSLCKTWLVFEVMFLASLSMLLFYIEVYISWSSCPTIFEQMFSCCDICDLSATDRHPYQVVLQHWRRLIITEVKNFRRILLLAPKDLKRQRKSILCFDFLHTDWIWSFQDRWWSITTPKYLYKHIWLVCSPWIATGSLCVSGGAPKTISSVFFVFMMRALLSLHSATLFTLCWCSPGSLRLFKREIKTVWSEHLRIHWSWLVLLPSDRHSTVRQLSVQWESVYLNNVILK